MDLFGDNKKKSVRADAKVIKGGGYEKMIEMRQDMMPEFETEIKKAFDQWNGQSLALIVMSEDENGEANGAQIVSLGVSNLDTQVHLVKTLDKLSNDLLSQMMKAAQDEPRAMKEILKRIKED